MFAAAACAIMPESAGKEQHAAPRDSALTERGIARVEEHWHHLALTPLRVVGLENGIDVPRHQSAIPVAIILPTELRVGVA